MSSWREALDQRLGGETPRAGAAEEAPDEAVPDLAPVPDPKEYKPWLLQRSRSRPAMFLDLRRFEPKAGGLLGCQLSYPYLVAFEYFGDHMVSLDFGTRQCIIEGKGLSNLVPWLQQGLVLAIQEYSSAVWPVRPTAEVISKIVIIEPSRNAQPIDFGETDK